MLIQPFCRGRQGLSTANSSSATCEIIAPISFRASQFHAALTAASDNAVQLYQLPTLLPSSGAAHKHILDILVCLFPGDDTYAGFIRYTPSDSGPYLFRHGIRRPE
jgi:hypothetical protein